MIFACAVRYGVELKRLDSFGGHRDWDDELRVLCGDVHWPQVV